MLSMPNVGSTSLLILAKDLEMAGERSVQFIVDSVVQVPSSNKQMNGTVAMPPSNRQSIVEEVVDLRNLGGRVEQEPVLRPNRGDKEVHACHLGYRK